MTEVAHAPARIPPEETALLARLRAGEAEAYERWVRASAPRVLAVARRLLRNEDDAQEVAQDAFLLAFRGLPKFDGTARLSTWLHRITVNSALMRLRTRRRHPEEPLEDLPPRLHADGQHDGETGAWVRNGEAAAASAELRKAVRAAIDGLPEIYRDVLLLRDIEEVSTREVAEGLGLTEAAVKTRLHRARLALRERLDDLFRELQGGAP